MNKRLLALLLALVMVFSLCACANDADKGDNGAEPTPSPTPAPELELGTVTDGRIYENAYFGFGCELDDTWVYASEDELLSMVQTTADFVDDDDFKEELLNADMFYDMQAVCYDGGMNINVVVENIGARYGRLLSEEDITDYNLSSLEAPLAAAGMDVQSMEKDTVIFAAEEHSGIKLHSIISGIDMYQLITNVKVGSYVATITLSSTVENDLYTMLGYFYEV